MADVVWLSNLNKNVFATEIAQNFSTALGSSSFILPMPAVLDSRKMRDLLEEDHNMGKVFQYGRDANIALVTMGSFGPKSALVHTGYISQDKMDELSARGAVGDICTHLIDINGNICDQELDQRTAAVPLEDIRNKKYRIGVAQGLSKVDCILGALKGKIVNVLITNEETAQWVLSKDEQLCADAV